MAEDYHSLAQAAFEIAEVHATFVFMQHSLGSGIVMYSSLRGFM